MTYALIVIGLLIVGVAVVAWATRRKPDETRTGPSEVDTAWNDPISGADPTVAPPRGDGAAGTTRSTDPRP